MSFFSRQQPVASKYVTRVLVLLVVVLALGGGYYFTVYQELFKAHQALQLQCL